LKTFVFVLYIVCFGTYLLFTRQPDFFDGERAPATIVLVPQASGATLPMAAYEVDGKIFQTNAYYYFRNWNAGEKIVVIYETNKPSKAAVYHWWGYFISIGEVIASIVLCVALFQIARSVVSNPTPEVLMAELEGASPRRKPKYDL